MLNPVRLVGRGLAEWWYNFVPLLLAGFVWLVLTVLVVTAGPATAVLFALMRRTSHHLYWGPREIWDSLKELFWVGWAWALLNGFVGGITAVNLAFYEGETGLEWLVLRLVWVGLLTGWLTLNLFFWPFWLAQSERGFRMTWGNCVRFLFKEPFAAWGLFLFTAVVLAFSLATVFPLVVGVVPFLALVALTAVEQALAPTRQKQAP